MWIYLKEGFFSIVEHPENKKYFLVRARAKGDIEKVFPDAQVQHTPDSDYAYRAPFIKGEAIAALAQKMSLINYKNFKDAIDDKDRREYWYNRVWDDMAMMQEHLADREAVGIKS